MRKWQVKEAENEYKLQISWNLKPVKDYRVPQMYFYSVPYLLSANLVTKQKAE